MTIAILLPVTTVIGLLVGSFANVAIHRWPDGGSVMHPSRSACPTCDAEIGASDNIPVISWLRLRGKCRACGASISGRYPAVELATALLFAAVTLVHGESWVLPALLAFSWALVVATAIDLEHQRIPNVLTYRLAPVLLVLLAGAAAIEGDWSSLRRAAIAGIALPAGMLALAEGYRLVRGRMGMGMGDIKLAASVGLAIGWLGGWHLVIWFYATTFSAFAIAMVLIGSGRAKIASKIPYGPYMAIGAVVAMLAGSPISAWAEARLGL